jgi:uncharacterized membrane protein YfcA
MDPAMPILPIITIIFLATFTRSALGFGDALIAMPLLAMIIDTEIATPLVAFGAATISITVLLSSWRSVELKSAWKLIISTLVGLPIGIYVLKYAPESIVKGVLGAVLIGFGLYSLVKPKLPELRSEIWVYLFGLAAGILGSAYNANGPPVVVYGTLKGWSPDKFRATLQAFFLPTGMSILISHGLAGLWTPTVLRLYAYGLPFALLAIFLGGKLNKMIPPGKFNSVVYVVLILMGVLLFV